MGYWIFSIHDLLNEMCGQAAGNCVKTKKVDPLKSWTCEDILIEHKQSRYLTVAVVVFVQQNYFPRQYLKVSTNLTLGRSKRKDDFISLYLLMLQVV